ncbi:MAG: hypothetical protein ABII23_03270, partial [bacterium]
MKMIDRLHKLIIKSLLAACTVAALQAVASANLFDHYELIIPSQHLMQGGEYTFTVRAIGDDGFIFEEAHYIDIIPPTGIEILEGTHVIFDGDQEFHLYVSEDAVPNNQPKPFKVENFDDDSNFIIEYVFVDYVIRGFGFNIQGGGVQEAGTEFVIEVTAQDAQGGVVSGFNGSLFNANVNLDPLIGDLNVTAGGNNFQKIFGTTFVDGIATISLKVYGTDGAENTINFKTEDTFIDQNGISDFGEADLQFSILPNVFSHVLLLFPGETHIPGTGIGKNGTPMEVYAGQEVGGDEAMAVDVYLVDTWNNPILNGDDVFIPGPVTVHFDDNEWQVGDRTPADIEFDHLNYSHINNDPFIFTKESISHDIMAMDHLGESVGETENHSIVPVIHGAASQFRITELEAVQSAVEVLDPLDPLITQLSIEAIDAWGNVDTDYNGQTAVLSILGGAVQTNAIHINPPDYSGAFPYLNAPNNIIPFVLGQWTGNILVTKAANAISLRVVDGAR